MSGYIERMSFMLSNFNIYIGYYINLLYVKMIKLRKDIIVNCYVYSEFAIKGQSETTSLLSLIRVKL